MVKLIRTKIINKETGREQIKEFSQQQYDQLVRERARLSLPLRIIKELEREL